MAGLLPVGHPVQRGAEFPPCFVHFHVNTRRLNRCKLPESLEDENAIRMAFNTYIFPF